MGCAMCWRGEKMWKDSRSHLFPSGTFHENEVVCGCCVSTNQMWYAILSRLLHRTSANVNNLSDRFAWHWVLMVLLFAVADLFSIGHEILWLISHFTSHVAIWLCGYVYANAFIQYTFPFHETRLSSVFVCFFLALKIIIKDKRSYLTFSLWNASLLKSSKSNISAL